MPNALKSNERRRIWVIKTFKIEIKKGGIKQFSCSAGLVNPK